MDRDELIKHIKRILHGIDKTESDGGWWETSVGAELGKDILDELITLIEKTI